MARRCTFRNPPGEWCTRAARGGGSRRRAPVRTSARRTRGFPWRGPGAITSPDTSRAFLQICGWPRGAGVIRGLFAHGQLDASPRDNASQHSVAKACWHAERDNPTKPVLQELGVKLRCDIAGRVARERTRTQRVLPPLPLRTWPCTTPRNTTSSGLMSRACRGPPLSAMAQRLRSQHLEGGRTQTRRGPSGHPTRARMLAMKQSDEKLPPHCSLEPRAGLVFKLTPACRRARVLKV